MNAREVANGYRLAQWGKVFSERVAGESIDQFCERNGISRNQYFYWQKKLREVVCGKLPQAPNGWAVCTTSKTEKSEVSMSVEVGKFKIAVTTDTESELLSRVCKVLGSIC